eukprot:SAG31_NODE_94_length_26208_cov_6.281091_8_plen_103_part_00
MKDVQIQLSIGGFCQAVSAVEVKTNGGRCKVYQEKEFLIRLPADLTQVPDIFVDVLIGGKRASYIRMPIYDHRTAGIRPELDMRMMFDGNIPRFHWRSLQVF